MSYCKYHPLTPATFRCEDCEIQTCDRCGNEGRHGEDLRCFLCDAEMTCLGAANQAEPFWRRFDRAFRYPLAASPLTLILVLSLLTSVLSFIPFAFLLYLAATGALIKYSFSCLQNTAQGRMTAPDITEAYGDGLALILRLLAIIIAITAAIVAINKFLGAGIAGLAGAVAIAALPAIIIIFAMTDSILEAINPARVFHLIGAIGLPYGLLLAIIMIMAGSVEFIGHLIGSDFSVITLTLNAIVSNYYTIVVFHIMGYMLFQFQAELGYTARAEGDEGPTPRDDREWVLAKTGVLIKEGEYAAAAQVFDAALKSMPNSEAVNTQYFEFLLATHDRRDAKSNQRLAAFASPYLQFLADNSPLKHKLGVSYQRVIRALPDYRPETARLRLLLAEACHKGGNPRSALRLLNGLHNDFPDFEDLVPAYQLMAEILDNQPGMAAQAEKCRLLIRKLAQRAARTDGTEPGAEPANPVSKGPTSATGR